MAVEVNPWLDEEETLRRFADLPTDVPDKRPTCQRCKRPCSVCLCPHLPKELLNITTTIYILQHPKEEYRLLTTVPILSASLPPEKCIILRDRKYSALEYPHLHNTMTQSNTLVLYPGPQAVNLSSLDLASHHEYNLIVPDGTWRQAKAIFHGNPFLLKATQIQVEHDTVSDYVIRTQPTNSSLCTVEAVALALALLERDDSIIQRLAVPLRALCQYQLDCGAVPHSSKEDKLQDAMPLHAEIKKGKETKRRRKRRGKPRPGEETKCATTDGQEIESDKLGARADVELEVSS